MTRRAGLALLLLSPGCVPSLCGEVGALPQDDLVLAIGDSILAWNKPYCQSAPDHLALERGASVQNNAVSGTRVLGGNNAIPDQYVKADWDWVIVDGGGNDVNDACSGDQAGPVIDQIVGADGTGGAMNALMDEIVADADQVLLLGYYPLMPDAWYGFDLCETELDTLDARYAALAEKRPQVTFVDLGQVLDPQLTPDAYAPDGVHPDTEGAQRIAELLHAVMLGLGDPPTVAGEDTGADDTGA